MSDTPFLTTVEEVVSTVKTWGSQSVRYSIFQHSRSLFKSEDGPEALYASRDILDEARAVLESENYRFTGSGTR